MPLFCIRGLSCFSSISVYGCFPDPPLLCILRVVRSAITLHLRHNGLAGPKPLLLLRRCCVAVGQRYLLLRVVAFMVVKSIIMIEFKRY